MASYATLAKAVQGLKKIISCFVIERKHRSLKRVALYVVRHLEHTSLTDLATQQCEQIIDGHSLFQREFLVHPTTVEVFGTSLTRSNIAVLECGDIHARDIIYVKGGQLARITGFWQSAPGIITAHCIACELVEGYKYRDSESVVFVQSQTIIDGEFRVALPFLARFR